MSMNKIIVKTEKAPAAIGPYSQAVFKNDVLYSSGQIPIDPATGELVKGGISEQAEQAFKNVGEVLNAAGLDFSNVVKTTVFLSDLNDFAAVNQIYARFFAEPYPARSCVQVAALPKNAKIEIEIIAAAN